MKKHTVRLTLNGRPAEGTAHPRMLLSDFLRGVQGATGTHVGCEHGVCGACTVRIDGATARSCLTFAVQIEGAEIDTVGLDPAEMLPLLAPILDIGPEHGYQPAAAEGLSTLSSTLGNVEAKRWEAQVGALRKDLAAAILEPFDTAPVKIGHEAQRAGRGFLQHPDIPARAGCAAGHLAG